MKRKKAETLHHIAAVDLFCGAGGLTYGMREEGIPVYAGLDIDPFCKFPIEANNPGTQFVEADVAKIEIEEIARFFPEGATRVLVGCAPCQPFSPYAHGLRHDRDEKWSLVDRFADIAVALRPAVVSMENTLELKNFAVYEEFVERLESAGYNVDAYNVDCSQIGIPQTRKRLVLFGSLSGHVKLEIGQFECVQTVRDTIGKIPPIGAGETDTEDPLHKAPSLSPLNFKRIRAAKPGGTWQDWEPMLQSPCHRRTTGKSFRSVYGRMSWDKPGPTITTQAYKFGTGRFGHPEQDRAISLREAALLQTFPADYRMTDDGMPIDFTNIGRLIGNAVPVRLGRMIARSIAQHLG